MSSKLIDFIESFSGKTVLIAGCGGGYDIFGGLPLYFHIKNKAKQVILVNLTLSDKQSFEETVRNKLGEELYPHTYMIKGYGDYEGISTKYFPEARLASILNHNVYAILVNEMQTVDDLSLSYASILKHELLDELDCFCLMDGGCDVLLKGTEHGLGTPVEDMINLKVVNALPKIKQKFVCALGVDVDIADGVHLNDLDDRLDELKSYCRLEWALSMTDEHVCEYIKVFRSCQPWNSIVQSLVIAALEGHDGYYLPLHLVNRISNNIVNITKRLCTFYVYPLDKIANDVIYLDSILNDTNIDKIGDIIDQAHSIIRNPANKFPIE